MAKKLAVKRLRTLARYMERLPKKAYEHFYMGTFFHHQGEHDVHAREGQTLGIKHLMDCGTSACALGWACTVPAFKKAGLKLIYSGKNYAGVCYPDAGGAMDAAETFFGLTRRQGVHLFDAHTHIQTPKQWAARCRAFIKRNGE